MKTKPILLSALFALPVIAGAALAAGGAANLALLQDAAKPNARDAAPTATEVQTQTVSVSDRDAALVAAADRGDAAVVDHLIKVGAHVNAANGFGATALYAAAGNADPGAAERLLAAGADPNARLPSGETPLMYAAHQGNAAVVRTLLKAHADPNLQGNGGRTALMLAAGHADVTAALLQAGANVHLGSKDGQTALMFAAQDNDARSAALLIKAGADPNAVASSGGWTALIFASAMSNTDTVHVLLANKADPNIVDAAGYTALIYAAHKKSAKALVTDLLEHGANPNARVLKHAPDLETYTGLSLQGATPLAVAAVTNNFDIIEALIDHRADPEIATNTGITPLMLGAGCYFERKRPGAAEEQANAIKTVKLLVAHGAKVNRVGQFKLTAVHCAALHGMNDVLRFLASKGANLDLKDDLGETPLSIASGIITKAAMSPGLVSSLLLPKVALKDTAALLLQLGATPLEKSGVEIGLKRGS